jgi:hypothetical protein
MIRKQLGEPIDGDYPPEFVEKYPELAGVVTVGRPEAVRAISARKFF